MSRYETILWGFRGDVSNGNANIYQSYAYLGFDDGFPKFSSQWEPPTWDDRASPMSILLHYQIYECSLFYVCYTNNSVYIYIYQLYHVLGIYFTVFSACLSKIHVLHLHTPSCPRSFRYVLFIFRSEYLSNCPTGVATSTPLRHNRMASVHIGCCEELTVPWCRRCMVGSDFQWGYHGATMGYSGNISRYYIVIYI